MRGFFGNIFSGVVEALVVMALLAVGGALLKHFGPKWLGVDWASLVPYSLGVMAMGMVLYTLLLALTGRLEGVFHPDHTPTANSVVEWLEDSGFATFDMPGGKDKALAVGFMYGKDTFTFNLESSKEGYASNFVTAKVIFPMPGDQAEWWRTQDEDSRNEIVRKVLLTVGLNMNYGINVNEVSSAGAKSFILVVENRIPIDQTLTKQRFLMDIESATRYLRSVRDALTAFYMESQNVPR